MSPRFSFTYVLCASLAVAGCASAPTQQAISSADYGTPMTPQECQTVAREHITRLLKDPSSAQFRDEPSCDRGWSGKAPLLGMEAAFGYTQTGQVNGKNAFGGYVGFRQYQVLMRNGRVVRSCMADQNGLCLLTNR
ncbi:hypothetical protein [Xanthomonas campestris]|uniref:hypothetical protein n=2 Tax=Xanthomonas campestris TaxID=339 RepID=UPI0013014702|nr:hypothetical protein [Xanthomonas campestris]MCC8686085.1 hypothetical protein [Xanthomonas campestris]MCC8692186.1 hypothetical protein [Xanthomonas campestris]MCF8825272.1 hypothetical protein [Xanthomonas campestris pv. raphani]MCW1998197.1 hypothetical protein [Xanthomonas campestris]MEA9677655.1 hypothetical protein [Xanthomonas campestris pv. raphani]